MTQSFAQDDTWSIASYNEGRAILTPGMTLSQTLYDTNMLVAAFATRGLCNDVLGTVLAEHELVINE